MTKKTISTQLKTLGFNQNEVNVYIALTQLGESHATTIAKKSGLPRTTVLSILEKMEQQGFVSIHRYKNRRIFWIESPHMLADMFKRQVKIAEELGQIMTEMYRSEADFPYAKVYDNKKTIRTFIEKTLLSCKKGTVISTIENPLAGNYHKILSEAFIDDMVSLKRKKKIMTHSLVTYDTMAKINKDKLQKQKIILREMPQHIKFTASFWIIEDMLFLFSGKYPFIVAIDHRMITQSMKSIFDFLWSISQKGN